MKNLISLFYLFFVSSAHAELFPAASVGYVRNVLNQTGVCSLQNSVPDAVAANMEYLMNVVDICNRGITKYGRSEYATGQMANINAVQHMTDTLYVADGLLIALDVNNMDDWIIVQGTTELVPNGIKLNSAVLRSREMLDLSSYQNVTIELRFEFFDTTQHLLMEHSSNWNTEKCGFGFVFNSNGAVYTSDVLHANANGPVQNHVIKTSDLISHTLVKTFTTIDNAHHLTFYDGVQLTEPDTTNYGEMYCSLLRNDYFYLGERIGIPVGEQASSIIHSLRIYNRALTAGEVCHNAWVDFRRFGGQGPDCAQ